jgi:hypothetical protein
MNAANETTNAMSQGLALGFHPECGLGLAAALNEYGSHHFGMDDRKRIVLL